MKLGRAPTMWMSLDAIRDVRFWLSTGVAPYDPPACHFLGPVRPVVMDFSQHDLLFGESDKCEFAIC